MHKDKVRPAKFSIEEKWMTALTLESPRAKFRQYHIEMVDFYYKQANYPGESAGKQEHWRALKTNNRLQVMGTNGSVYALGDASTVSQVKHVVFLEHHAFHQSLTAAQILLMTCSIWKYLLKKTGETEIQPFKPLASWLRRQCSTFASYTDVEIRRDLIHQLALL